MQSSAYTFIKKESLTQVFSCEYCEILWTPILNNISELLLLEIKTSNLNVKNGEPNYQFQVYCKFSKQFTGILHVRLALQSLWKDNILDLEQELFTCYSLSVNRYSLLFTIYLLLFTRYSLHVTRYFLPVSSKFY